MADSAATHTILWDQKYFSHITLVEANVNIISGPIDLIDGSGRATIMLPCGTIFILTMSYIQSNPEEICLVLKIYVIMDIILIPHTTIIKNIYALLVLFQTRSL